MKPSVRTKLIVIAVVVVVVGIFIGIGMFVSSLAHDPVTGVVERVGTVTDSEYVGIKIEGNPELFTCDERCYAIHEGDTVTLSFSALATARFVTRATIDQTAERK